MRGHCGNHPHAWHHQRRLRGPEDGHERTRHGHHWPGVRLRSGPRPRGCGKGYRLSASRRCEPPGRPRPARLLHGQRVGHACRNQGGHGGAQHLRPQERHRDLRLRHLRGDGRRDPRDPRGDRPRPSARCERTRLGRSGSRSLQRLVRSPRWPSDPGLRSDAGGPCARTRRSAGGCRG